MSGFFEAIWFSIWSVLFSQNFWWFPLKICVFRFFSIYALLLLYKKNTSITKEITIFGVFFKGLNLLSLSFDKKSKNLKKKALSCPAFWRALSKKIKYIKWRPNCWISYFWSLFGKYLSQMSWYRAEIFTAGSLLQLQHILKISYDLNVSGLRSIFEGWERVSRKTTFPRIHICFIKTQTLQISNLS
jgi:hypothetical protein